MAQPNTGGFCELLLLRYPPEHLLDILVRQVPEPEDGTPGLDGLDDAAGVVAVVWVNIFIVRRRAF